MNSHYEFFYVLVLLTFESIRLSDEQPFINTNALNGKHLRVLGLQFPASFTMERNATGHIINTGGPCKHMVEALSKMLNFSYSFVPDPFLGRLRLFDDSPLERGAVSYLIQKEADYVIGGLLGSIYRIERADLSSSWNIATYSGIVPYPRPEINLAAALKPLSYQVWVVIVASILVVAFYLRILSYKPFSSFQNERNLNAANSSYVFSYVVGNILSQGQRCISERLAVRIAAGAWCLGCFFLVQIYCTTLTSHLTAPNQKPIVNSFDEIAYTPGARLAVDRGYAIDSVLMLQNNKHTGYMKRLSDMLRDDPSLRCNLTSECMKKVQNGHTVYANSLTTLQVILAAELKRSNNTCEYTLMKETFWHSTHLHTALRKHSPYTETINRGIWRLREAGLISVWDSWYVPSANALAKCMDINQRKKNFDSEKSKLSVGNLSSAFVFLIISSVLSFTAFTLEKIMSLFFHCTIEN